MNVEDNQKTYNRWAIFYIVVMIAILSIAFVFTVKAETRRVNTDNLTKRQIVRLTKNFTDDAVKEVVKGNNTFLLMDSEVMLSEIEGLKAQKEKAQNRATYYTTLATSHTLQIAKQEAVYYRLFPTPSPTP